MVNHEQTWALACRAVDYMERIATGASQAAAASERAARNTERYLEMVKDVEEKRASKLAACVVTFVVTLILVGTLAKCTAQGVVEYGRVTNLVVTKNADLVNLPLVNGPSDVGALYVEWTPANNDWKGFTHFVHQNGPLSARTTYTGPYGGPVRMQLSLNGGRVNMFDGKVPQGPDHFSSELVFRAGVRYRILWTWAEVAGVTTLGCFVNGKLVSFRRHFMGAAPIGQWTWSLNWGAKGLEAVEPT